MLCKLQHCRILEDTTLAKTPKKDTYYSSRNTNWDPNGVGA